MSVWSGRHPHDELQALLDGRLEAAARAELERHLATCDSCRGELAALRRVKDALAEVVAPDSRELAERIRAALDREDAARRPWQRRAGPRALAAAALVAAAGLALLVSRPKPDLPAAAEADLRALAADSRFVQLETSSAEELQTWFAARDLDFATSVYDLAMMDLPLVGGSVGTFADDRPSTVAVYRARDGRWVVCRMYRGSLAELPRGVERRRDDGEVVRVFERGDVVVAFWQEGAVVCYFAARGLPVDQLVALAFAKASRV